MKAVAYCRVSTDNQKDERNNPNPGWCHQKYCSLNDILLLEIFKDQAVSGSNDIENRVGLPALFTFLNKTDLFLM